MAVPPSSGSLAAARGRRRLEAQCTFNTYVLCPFINALSENAGRPPATRKWRRRALESPNTTRKRRSTFASPSKRRLTLWKRICRVGSALSPLARQCDKMRRGPYDPHADSPSRSLDHRPHRRGGSDRAAGGCDQGTDRERPRRRARNQSCTLQAGGRRLDPGRRRRAWAGRTDLAPASSGTRRRNLPGRSHADRHFRLSRRGAALNRLGVAAEIRTRSAARRRPEADRRGRRKSAVEPCASPSARGSRRATCLPPRPRGSSSQIRSRRGAGRGGCGQAARDGAPEVRFSFTTDLGASFDWPAAGAGKRASPSGSARRWARFAANSVALDARREGLSLTGRVGLPTYQPPNASQQFLFVNGRTVRDKTLAGALEAPPTSCPPTGMRSRRCLSNAIRRGRRQRPPCKSRSALSRRGGRARPDCRRHQAAFERSAASRLDHRRDGDDPRHAAPATLAGCVLFSPLGLAPLARGPRGLRSPRRQASPRSRPPRRRRRPCPRARHRRSAGRGAGAAARELYYRPDAGRRRHCRPARRARAHRL